MSAGSGQAAYKWERVEQLDSMRSGKVKKKICLVLDGPEPGDDGRLALLDEFDGLADLCGAFHVDILIVGWPSIPNGLRQRMTEPLRSLGAAIRFVDPSDYADIQPETAHRGKSLAMFRHLSEEGDYDNSLPWPALAGFLHALRPQSEHGFRR